MNTEELNELIRVASEAEEFISAKKENLAADNF